MIWWYFTLFFSFIFCLMFCFGLFFFFHCFHVTRLAPSWSLKHLNAVNTGQAKCACGSTTGASLSGWRGPALLCARYFFRTSSAPASLLNATRVVFFFSPRGDETTDICRVWFPYWGLNIFCFSENNDLKRRQLAGTYDKIRNCPQWNKAATRPGSVLARKVQWGENWGGKKLLKLSAGFCQDC